MHGSHWSKSVEDSDLIQAAGDSGSAPAQGIPKSTSMYEGLQQPMTSSDMNEDNWSITFEQFLASILNEDILVRAFDQKVDIVAKLAEQDRKSLSSSVSKPLKSSEFYV